MTVGLVLAIAQALLKALGAWSERARDKQLLDAGEASAIARSAENGIKAIKRAQAIRRGIADLSDADRDDRLRPPEKRSTSPNRD